MMVSDRDLNERLPAEQPAVTGRRVPLVTVVLPVYSRLQFLAQAITSVLEQSHPRIQLIVVDDGSPLNLEKVMTQFRTAVEFYRKTQGGPASARNFGIRRARGEFLLFLDDDDYLEPRAVEVLLKALEGSPDLAWASGRLAYVDERGRYLPKVHPCQFQSGDVYAEMIQNNLIGTPSATLVRTQMIRTLGGFDENPRYQFCEDYDLWLTLARDFPVAAIPEVVSNYRYHAGNATRQWARHYPAWLATLEKHRAKARPGFDAAFQSAIARVHLNFGDELYVHGQHAEARQQWTQALQRDPQLRRRLLLRYSKSYLPRGVLDALRSVLGWVLGGYGKGSIDKDYN